jgi:hypothetical protein
MAASSTTSGFSIARGFPTTAPIVTAPVDRIQPHRRRIITPQAGRALEVLGHAIEYLTDEFVHEGGGLAANNAQLEAVQLLMAFNRQVYFECPEAPTFAERCRSLLRIHAA